MSENNTQSENLQPPTPKELENKYRYIKLLGEGANGKTYLAIQINTGIHVAVKALKFAQANDFKSLELFKREASILSSIKMEGIPQFYESIFPNDGGTTCYIIQEYVKYPSLQEIIDLGTLDEQTTLLIIERIALLLFGLQTIHTPPIIHRDIKPSNILYKKEADQINVYLIDFGAVANPQRRSGGSTVAGTFGYMAPEQLLGDICIQSDFYSLGATALHLLTGIPPYKLESDGFKIDYEPVLNEHAPKTSKAMKSLLSILLAPEIDKRPANAQQLLQIVHKVQNGEVVSIKTLEDTVSIPMTEESSHFEWFHQFLNKHFSKKMKPVDTTANWKKCQGFIRCRNVLIANKDGSARPCYEYTFEVNQKTYVGAYFGQLNKLELNKLDQKTKRGEFKIQCVVAYNPDNPRMNYIPDIKKIGNRATVNDNKLKWSGWHRDVDYAELERRIR